MWKNWLLKPFVCLSSGYIAQTIVWNIYEVKHSFNKEHNLCDYRREYSNRMLAFWTGIVGSFVIMRYYSGETPKLLKNE